MAKAKKPAFGGYAINFKGCRDTLESVMGSSPIVPSEMTKRIWGYVKKKKIARKGPGGGHSHVRRQAVR